MEENVFPDGAVAPILEEHYVEARLHTDGETNIDAILELQKELTGSLANPYYVLQHPDFAEALGKHAGFLGAEKFKEFLEEALPGEEVARDVERATQ